MVRYGFNPRAHVGRDPTLRATLQVISRFNPRAHVGRDRCVRLPLHVCLSFNPRAHVGRDTADTQSALAYHQFQSTRPRGARLAYLIQIWPC